MILKRQNIIFLFIFITLSGIGMYFLFRTEVIQKYKAKVLNEEFVPNQDLDLAKSVCMQEKDSIYSDFRKKCRFHFQTVGLATFADSSYLFLISEPAPYVTVDSVLSVFQKFNIHSEVKTHAIGYDGWVKDILICVGRATSENISNLNKNLSQLLYLSDYKPHTLALPLETSRVHFSNNKLNYRISLSEINQWFIEDEELFLDLPDTTTSFTITDVFKANKEGVFYSQQPGFVIWSINKKKEVHLQKANIRKFTLDADLILGAISDSTTLIIIGRERESNIMELPPLNVETILLLASIKDGELSQSLDINDLLAGKMANNKDWCPTYLSPQLENTEFGHLLTITDVLLKDWSENGTLQYEDYSYPKPALYPFDRPLFSKLGLNELVYNWNTANTMFAYDYNGMNLYALNRTGSLPVSYFNSQANYISVGHSYENTAYNYFSTLCNTDLIRVVQYTSLYQLFIDNEIVNTHDTINYMPKNKPYLLSGSVKKLLNNIKELDTKTLDSISGEIANVNYKRYQHSDLLKQIANWENNYNQTIPKENREEIIRNAQLSNKNSFRSQLSSLQNQLRSLDEQDFAALCRYLSYPRGEHSQKTLQKIYRIAYNTMQTIHLINKTNLKYFGIDLASIKSYYSNSLKNSSSPWMKTPSLIVSYNSARLTGGHNLSSKIRRVNSINADKAIISSGRPQAIPKNYASPSKPSTTGNVKPKVQNYQPKVNASPIKEPVRKRSEVISSSARKQRGF